ncbi:hypothetical protein Z045_22900 [Rhodococcus pyridinivorans KG-16]|uniref:TIGR02677 family protein n=1 Tax=Rhodococcus pyridinivorans KG-16 TaxID=1441730 RepID=A0A0V9UEU9_9NOCA|nr:DUF2397 domain-containing protein [Rhodococcus pyridinivorans]KSZ56451.1 hypothetical protein Z045_22900 [Rhodococcus pyridinivorans KG-16]
MGEHIGRDLFRHLVADEADEYLAVMDCFTDLLLADLSADDIAVSCARRGVALDIAVVDARCRSLVRWGNLALTSGGTDGGGSHRRSAPETASTEVRARYRPTPAGLRVHRETGRLLSTSDDVRGVARVSLRCVADGLARIEELLVDDGSVPDRDELAAHVTALFAHHRLFTDSVADFYSHLAEILSRLERSGRLEHSSDRERAGVVDDYAETKNLLLDYVDVIGSDVERLAPLVAGRLDRMEPRLDSLLAAVRESGPPNTVPGSPGRSRTDWDELAQWYAEDAGPRRMREAAASALNRLLVRTRRITTTTPGFSHRADLLRLARWFTESSDEQAHRLFAATFGAFPSRHLLLGPDETDPRVGAGTSWWRADPVVVPVSLRERGDHTSRGAVGRLPDSLPGRVRADELARRESRRRSDAVAELGAAGDLHGADLSTEARDVLLDVLAAALAGHRTTDGPVHVDDPDLGLSLTAEPGADTVVHSPDGDLTVHGFRLRTSATAPLDYSAVAP